jgi:hypothetical protein
MKQGESFFFFNFDWCKGRVWCIQRLLIYSELINRSTATSASCAPLAACSHFPPDISSYTAQLFLLVSFCWADEKISVEPWPCGGVTWACVSLSQTLDRRKSSDFPCNYFYCFINLPHPHPPFLDRHMLRYSFTSPRNNVATCPFRKMSKSPHRIAVSVLMPVNEYSPDTGRLRNKLCMSDVYKNSCLISYVP